MSKKFSTWAINLNKHLQRTFALWTIKKPSLKTQFYRSTVFLFSLLLTIFWPIPNLLINLAITSSLWFILGLIKHKIHPAIIMLNLMLSISLLYYIMKFYLPTHF